MTDTCPTCKRPYDPSICRQCGGWIPIVTGHGVKQCCCPETVAAREEDKRNGRWVLRKDDTRKRRGIS